MIIVAGHIIVDSDDRDSYLSECAAVIEQARSTPGCLDFALSADLIDPTRINVFERWGDVEALTAFRGDGPSSDQQQTIRDADVREFDVREADATESGTSAT
ncbi:putative quinol monooxygenase [Gordonia sp. OPL2]|uniref:putative quinol monooxygenase n=1 Tax=Gordonia sp. OPL2 TaxID=2486274 RepID=UPI001655C488|nr:antibiotic biosynthesis monooxygenase [Gordonia sp. OPL2]RPA19839.1 antibiotic biosynthesis monooxygenase [Gordonia sp. OPL2]